MRVINIQLSEQKLQPSGHVFPLVKSPAEPTSTRDETLAWVRENREQLRAEMMTHGAVLLRGFCVENAHDFEAVLEAGASRELQLQFITCTTGDTNASSMSQKWVTHSPRNVEFLGSEIPGWTWENGQLGAKQAQSGS